MPDKGTWSFYITVVFAVFEAYQASLQTDLRTCLMYCFATVFILIHAWGYRIFNYMVSAEEMRATKEKCK